jgi:hypothetical protein
MMTKSSLDRHLKYKQIFKQQQLSEAHSLFYPQTSTMSTQQTPVTASDAQLAGPATVVEPAPPAYSPPQTDGTTLATEQPAPVRDLPANPAAPQQEQVQLVTPLEQLGDSPAWIDCPWCHRRTKTVVRTEGTTKQMYELPMTKTTRTSC